VKGFSPILRYGFETVECHIPTSLSNMKDPVIDGLDVRIENLKERAQNFGPRKRLSDVHSSVKSKTNEVVTTTTEKWKDVKGKATEGIEKGVGKVCEISATRGKDVLHVDLIQYSREVLEGASTTVSQRFYDANATVKLYSEAVKQRVAQSVLRASEAMGELQHAIVALSTEKMEQVRLARANLRLKLRKAVQAARELSASSVDFVHTKYGEAKERISHVPTQVISHLPAPAQKSVNFILSSPQLFTRIKDRAEMDASKRTLENINNLMSAVKEVVFEGDGGEEGEVSENAS